ncbi:MULTISPECIES: hypothetical protein [unclassified Microbacterium]|uniref:hypothetical protein n=1 Tax=unclassified Microbacterium TaxID=2609290 RepID=UPI001604CD6F|nr:MULTISPECIES: hypothetical protein [unclassified Microbacterium]QNA92953.1 hypothetical protein G4G29_12415 [Microbacterium sp. Se63.02b]
MTELAYMVREDWGQHGTAMVSQSAVIREWLGEAPYLFAVTDVKKFSYDDRSADVEAAEFIAPAAGDRKVFSISELSRLDREDKVIDHTAVVLHPFEQRELETVRRAVEADLVGRLFVLIWSRHDMVRIWLDGLGATNLHAGESVAPADSLMLAAAEMMRNEDYNGLSSSRGKDAVVQLIRAFAAEGYPVEPAPWLRAYFAVGGSFRHAESIEKLVKEMKAGTRHRVKPRYRDNIVEIIREQVTAKR